MLKGPLKWHIAKTYGLYRDSTLNPSRYFHVVDGLAPDNMHLKGSLQYQVKELLKHCIQTETYFTLEELNTVIEEFPFVLSDKATSLLKQKGEAHAHTLHYYYHTLTLLLLLHTHTHTALLHKHTHTHTHKHE